MKTKTISSSLLVALWVLSCAQPDRAVLWSPEQISLKSSECLQGVLEAGETDPTIQARGRSYCECIYQEAARRWTFPIYESDTETCEKTLDLEVSDLCLESAKGGA